MYEKRLDTVVVRDKGKQLLREGELSVSQIAERLNKERSVVRSWRRQMERDGETVFRNRFDSYNVTFRN